MIETAIKTLQKNNKKADIMGVIRTLYPNVEITQLEKNMPKGKRRK
jgi:hypothetical protein